jgi:hypothetical protein
MSGVDSPAVSRLPSAESRGRQAEEVSERCHGSPLVGPIPGAYFTRSSYTILTTADDAIDRAKTSDPARFGLFDI